jgi:glycosyltransferase involved in cell wall biosynthesis
MHDPLEIVFAAETLVPPVGGAERFWIELAAGLAERHNVRALAFDARVAGPHAPQPAPPGPEHEPPPGVEWIEVEAPARGGGWTARSLRRVALHDALVQELSERPADVVAGQLHPGPAAITAAQATGAAGVLFVPGYEALCHWGFGAGSNCLPATRCRECPRVLALEPPERAARWAEREAQDEALASAAALIAPSPAMAAAVERVCGRPADVVPPVTARPAPARAHRDGHVGAIASFWSVDKGVELLAPIAERLGDRRLVVQVPPAGLRADVAAALEALPNATLRRAPGPIDDLLDGAALLIVPSQIAEPFGRVAFEGLAAGVPTLVSDTGGLGEMAPSAQRVSPHADPDAWAAAIRSHLEPGRWAEARLDGVAAAERVLAGGSPVELAERLLIGAARGRAAAAAG